MTIESTITRVVYEGNGVTRRFSLPFPLLAESHVEVYVTDVGVKDSAVIQPLATGYRVENIALNEPCLVFPEDGDAPPLGKGRVLTAVRKLPLVQQMNLENGGNLQAEILETQFDILTMQMQQLAYGLERAVKIPPYSANQSMSVADFFARMEKLCDRAEAAALRLEKQEDLETIITKAMNKSETWVVKEDMAPGSVLTLPVHYLPQRSMLVFSVDGVLCYPRKIVDETSEHDLDTSSIQYEEIADEDTASNAIRLFFPLPKGSICHALVLGQSHHFD